MNLDQINCEDEGGRNWLKIVIGVWALVLAVLIFGFYCQRVG
jgi:hypothetical protein